MTQNQIAYFNARELQRHNKASETESQRHNQVSEILDKWRNELQSLQISEMTRSNLANEEIKRQQNAINAGSVQETIRHNQMAEQLTALTTQSQTSLNKALASQASASATSSYAAADLSREKINTEKSVQTLNSANAGFTTTQNLNYDANVKYTLSQSDLNKARIVQTQAQTGQIRVNTELNKYNTAWGVVRDTINSIAGMFKTK